MKLSRKKRKVNIDGLHQLCRESWEGGNYLKCKKIVDKLLKYDKKDKVALIYKSNLKLINIEAEEVNWYNNSTHVDDTYYNFVKKYDSFKNVDRLHWIKEIKFSYGLLDGIISGIKSLFKK